MKKKKEKKNRAASFKKLAGKSIFIILASFWMFVLGIFVGRGTAPFTYNINRIDDQLAELKKEFKKKAYEKHKINPNGFTSNTDLAFYEELKKTKSAPLLPEGSSARAGKMTGRAKKKSVKKKEKIVKPPTGADKQKKTPKDIFAIQVASMKSSKAAVKLAADLAKKGYPAYKTSALIPGKGRYHRVRIGNFATRKKALAMIRKLRANGMRVILVQARK